MGKIAGIGLVVALVVALVGGTAYILLRPKAETGLGHGAQSQERVEARPWLKGYWGGGEVEYEWGQHGTDRRG